MNAFERIIDVLEQDDRAVFEKKFFELPRLSRCFLYACGVIAEGVARLRGKTK